MFIIRFILISLVLGYCIGATIYSQDPFVASSFGLLSSQSSSWRGGVLPTAQDDVIIDLGVSSCNSSAKHYFVFDASTTFKSLTIQNTDSQNQYHYCTTRVYIRQNVVVTSPKVTLSGSIFGTLLLGGTGASLVGQTLAVLDRFVIAGSGTLDFTTISSNDGILIPGAYASSNPEFPGCFDLIHGYNVEMPAQITYGDLNIKGTFTANTTSTIAYGSFDTKSEFTGRFRPGRMVAVVIFDRLNILGSLTVTQYGPTSSSASMVEWKQLTAVSNTSIVLTYSNTLNDFFGMVDICASVGVITQPPAPLTSCASNANSLANGYTGLGVLILPPSSTCSAVTCSSPCLNGGTCTTAGVCACTSEYTGFSCSLLAATSSSSSTTQSPNNSSTSPATTDSPSNNNVLVLGLAIGIPVAVAAGVGVGLIIYFVHKHQEKSYTSSQMSKLRQEERG